MGLDGRAAIIDPCCHGEPAAVLASLENEARGRLLPDHRHPFGLPADIQPCRPCRLERGAIGNPRHDLDRFPAIPGRRRLEREDRIGDRLADLDRDIDRLRVLRIDGAEPERGLLVPRHPPGVDGAMKRVSGDDRFLATAGENPRDLERPAGPGGERGRLPLGDLDSLGGDAEIKARPDEMADKRLERFLVFVVELRPGGGADDIRHPDLVNVPGEVVLVVPAADPHPRRAGDLQRGRVGSRRAVEDTVDVEERFSLGVRVNDMHPRRLREPRPPGDISP